MRTNLGAAVAVAVLVSLLAAPGAARAQGPDLTGTLSLRGWATLGASEWRQEIAGGLLASELDWQDIDAVVVELGGVVVWKRLVVTGALGGGAVDDGRFVDDDYVAGLLVSRTVSDVADSGLFHAGGNVGVRAGQWRQRDGRGGHVDLLAGYQFWREEYRAFGLRGDPTVPASRRVISQDWTWHSLRVGGRLEVPLPWRLALRAEGYVLPWSTLEVRDVHPLRTDLRQDPSFLTEATGGLGWQLDAALVYAVWKGLSAEAGARYWTITMEDGTVTARSTTETSRADLERATTERFGPYLGLTYRF